MLPNSLNDITINKLQNVNPLTTNRGFSRLYENDKYIFENLNKVLVNEDDTVSGYLIDKIVGSDTVTVQLSGDQIQIEADGLSIPPTVGVDTTGTTLNNHLAVFDGNDVDFIKDSGIDKNTIINLNTSLTDTSDVINSGNFSSPYDILLPCPLLGYSSATEWMMGNDLVSKFIVYPRSYISTGFPTIPKTYKFYGKITTSIGGTYRIVLTTNDLNINLKIGGTEIIASTPFYDNSTNTFANVNISANVIYDIEVTVTCGQWSNGLILSWQNPDQIASNNINNKSIIPIFHSLKQYYTLNPDLRPGGVTL